ncbi:hypothetical protein ACJD0Z_10575 [Flavobacteriaceae bacterium M23B6Z8]
MKNVMIYALFFILLSGCSIMKNDKIYQGSYKEDNIELSFLNSKKGRIVINKIDTIPFVYKIEKNRINPKTNKVDELKFYFYRFTINAKYELNFPIGFYEIGQKGGDILQGSDGLTLVSKRK